MLATGRFITLLLGVVAACYGLACLFLAALFASEGLVLSGAKEGIASAVCLAAAAAAVWTRSPRHRVG